MALIGSVRSNITRENEGDWVDIPDLVDVKFKVWWQNYPPYQMAKSIVEQRWARRFGQREPVPPEILFRENGRLYADHILLGWEGFDDMPYDATVVRQMLVDPQYRTLHDHIRYAMQQISDTEILFGEEVAPNLSPSSSGN